jgi:hypothetical protein
MTKSVGRIFAARALQGRSPLYRWLHEHHAEIAAVLAAQVRPGWQALAATAAEAGVRTADGHAPSRHLTRKTWKLVERAMAKSGQPQPAPAVPAVHPAVAERQPVLMRSPVLPGEPNTPPPPAKRRFDIKPATFKKDD